MMSKQKDEQVQANLGKAGDGLPLLEGIFLKHMLFPLLKNFMTWDKALFIFEREGHKILNLVKDMSHEQLFARVLIPRKFALEDNSRYYSAAMVLWHLVYVGDAIEQGIIDLSLNREIGITVKIANFKPYVPIQDDIVELYASFLSDYRTCLDTHVGDKFASTTHIHPWFGALNPYEWLVMSMAHQFIHRRQLEAIVNTLSK